MAAADSPMFVQYRALKERAPGAILFFRMGDFYEMFFEDAELAARELELTLTARNKQDPDPVPMAGVPHHAAAAYIQRLTERGYRVAIAEQVEDPATARGLVDRDIVRVVSPGVPFDPTALAGHTPNHLVALVRERERVGVAFLEASTGDLRGTDVIGAAAAASEIHRFEPREVLVGPGLEQLPPELEAALEAHGAIEGEVDPEAWRPREARRELHETLGVADLTGFGVGDGELWPRAAGALLRYLRDATGRRAGNVHALRPYAVHGHMALDDTTRRNLELFRTLLDGRRQGSLIGLLDRCATAMGSRRLREWLSFPLLDPAAIRERQVAVGELVDEAEVRDGVLADLRAVADIERIGARVAQRAAHPRDLAALRRSLDAAPQVVARVAGLGAVEARCPVDLCGDVAMDLATWLVEDPPLTPLEGDLVPDGAHAELDELRAIGEDALAVIAALEERERAATGISSLKIRSNKVFGFYFEVTQANAGRVPQRFLRKQTLKGAERFITPELKELEERVLGAGERKKALEYELFQALRERVAAASPRLLALAAALADLDALAALAATAARHRWVAPEVDRSGVLDIAAGRHPVVEAALAEERFVPNDVRLDAEGQRLVVLTGPNMAGKSTVLRQVALIALLAQIGSFVPAERARVGVCDRIFTRVGAADDLARGRSTFMVEMAETASILHGATRHSLVVLDEIGRGTSTYDGLSIAWAVAEDVALRVGCRALFATHYHELCDLAELHPCVVNRSVAVSDRGEEIVFLRRLKEGGASRSYGIQCARLAGLPHPVLARARELLKRFEKHAPRNEREQLSLFAAARPAQEVAPEPAPEPDRVRALLAEVDPDALSPREAHEILYRLRSLL